MQMHEIIHHVLAEEAEEFAGAVLAAVGGAVEFEEALAGEVLGVVLGGDEDGEFQGAGDAAEGEVAAQEVVGGAVGAVGDALGGGGGEFGGGVVLGVEEIGGAQVREEHGVQGRVAEVFTGDGGHVDGEAGGDEGALAHVDFAAGEAHGAAVVIEEIAAGPADHALGGVDAIVAIGNGGRGDLAGAFEGASGGALALPGGENGGAGVAGFGGGKGFIRRVGAAPFLQSALEHPHVGVAGGAQFFRCGDGIEGRAPGPVDDERRRRVEGEGVDVIEKGRFVDAGIPRAGDAAGGEDLGREDMEERRRLGRTQ